MYEEREMTFLEELLNTPSPVGYESQGQTVWLNYIEQFSDDIQTDSYGSAVAKIDTNFDVATIMLEAHCDEIGMMIQHINSKGFVYLNKLGGSDSTIARAKRVNIHNKKGVVTGVIGNTAIHLQDKKNGGGKQPGWEDIYVDIGANSKEEALELVQIGDPVTYTDQLEFINDEIITGRALDNRIGGFVIAQVFRKLSQRKKDLNVNVLALNSVQEEIGGYGARMMSHRLMPDAALVTDVTHATDTPGIDNKKHGLVKLGSGPSISHGAANHPKIVEVIEEVAKTNDISIQHEASSYRTGTDTDSIYHQRSGIPSALLSLPQRYMHSPSEVVSKKDIDSLVTLMEETVLAMKPDQTFSTLNR